MISDPVGRSVLLGSTTAAIFWFLMFSPWTKYILNFWHVMTVASGLLAVYAFLELGNERRGLYVFRLQWIVIGIGSAVLLYLIFFVGDKVSSLLFEFAAPQVSGIYGTKAQASSAAVGALLFFWIGPAEEVFWRGFVQHRMQTRYGLWNGYVLTAAVYAGIHIWAFNFMLLMAALICGLFWGWMFLKYKSVWPGLISHAVWDLVIFVLLPIR
jgi:membrane protease YdiL (CAAX protease family)